MKKMEKVIVTRHGSLVKYLIEQGIANPETPVLEHVTPQQIEGKVVIGVLPLHLAARASRVIVVPINAPPELRGQELSIEQVRQYAGEAQEYFVTDVARY